MRSISGYCRLYLLFSYSRAVSFLAASNMITVANKYRHGSDVCFHESGHYHEDDHVELYSVQFPSRNFAVIYALVILSR